MSEFLFDIDPGVPPTGQILGANECQPAMIKTRVMKFMSFKAEQVELRAKGIAATDILSRDGGTESVDGMGLSKLRFAVASQKAAQEIERLIERRVETGLLSALPWKSIRPRIGRITEHCAYY